MSGRYMNLTIGLLLIVIGVFLGGRVFDIWNFDIFFDGWWSLFIIIPCVVNIVKGGPNIGSFIGLFIGVLLFLSAQNLIDIKTVSKLVFPCVIILGGLKQVFDFFKQK